MNPCRVRTIRAVIVGLVFVVTTVSCGGATTSALPPADASYDVTPEGPADVWLAPVDASSSDSAAIEASDGLTSPPVDADDEGQADADDASSTCIRATCATLGYDCGTNGDGCGGTLECGTCKAPAHCGGGGFSRCGIDRDAGADSGPGPCFPTNCGPHSCGVLSDGCGAFVNCGSCIPPEFCGGGGFNQCGNPYLGPPDAGDAAGLCTPLSCDMQGVTCGPASDECGHLLNCGQCKPPLYCGGGGPGRCG